MLKRIVDQTVTCFDIPMSAMFLFRLSFFFYQKGIMKGVEF